MDMRKLGNILFFGGLLMLIVALIWWWNFYGSAARQDGGKASDVLSCLYSSGGLCGLAKGLAQLVGKTAYEPLVFQIGAVAAVIGGVLKATTKSDD